jgi:hypothetical protein
MKNLGALAQGLSKAVSAEDYMASLVPEKSLKMGHENHARKFPSVAAVPDESLLDLPRSSCRDSRDHATG